MQPQTRGIRGTMRYPLPRHHHYVIYRDGEFYVIYDYLNQQRRYYAHLQDVCSVLQETSDNETEEQKP
jgi:hypothetical protein